MARDGDTRGYPSGMGLTSVIANLLFHGGRNISHCYVGSRRGKVTSGREHLAGPALRGEPGPAAGGGLPDAVVGGRDGRCRTGVVAAAQPRRHRRVHNLRAWPSTVVARVCLDVLRFRTARGDAVTGG